MDDDELEILLRNERYPRSAGYSARWMVDGAMGPNPVWQAEALAEVLTLEPGLRVLDLGCGSALSSIFLAKEFGVEVWAADLWVKPHENLARIAAAGMEDRVYAVFAEAHALPFAEGFFDALPPDHLEPYWKWDFCAWHSPGWWRRHWEKTGLVTVDLADRLTDGWQDWLQWNKACDLDNGTPRREEAQMLHADAGRALGFTRVVARRTA